MRFVFWDACGTKSGLQARPPLFNKLRSILGLPNRSRKSHDFLAVFLRQLTALFDVKCLSLVIECVLLALNCSLEIRVGVQFDISFHIRTNQDTVSMSNTSRL